MQRTQHNITVYLTLTGHNCTSAKFSFNCNTPATEHNEGQSVFIVNKRSIANSAVIFCTRLNM